MTDHLRDPDPPTTDSLTFVGTATTVLRLGAFTLLTDPNFLHRGQRAYLGKGMWSRRLTEPALGVEELPALDAVLLSHLHGDHFDRVARRSLARDQPVLTTPSAARRLDRWGFTTVGLPTWGEQRLHRDGETLSVTAVPAVHARGALRALLPSVMGSVLEHRVDDVVRRRVYVSGDTVTGPHLTEIARRHPDLDVAVVHLGGTRVLWHTVTMDAPQGVELLRTVPTQQVVPVHHDDYRVFRDPLSRFVQLARSQGLDGRLTLVGRGETVALAGRD